MSVSRHRCEDRHRRYLGYCRRNRSTDRSLGRASRRPCHHHRTGIRGAQRRRGLRSRERPQNHCACTSARQETPRRNAPEARTSGGRDGRRHQRRPCTQNGTRRFVDGRRHLGGERSQRHHDHRQLVLEHWACCDVGPLALPKHPALHPLPNDGERSRLLHCVGRCLHGHRFTAHGDADALGEPHHGHVCCHGTGFAAAC